MQLHAQECYPQFNETVKAHIMSQSEATEWSFKSQYQSNINRLKNKVAQQILMLN